MKSKKRNYSFIAILAVLALSLTAFVGCKKSSGTNGSGIQPTSGSGESQTIDEAAAQGGGDYGGGDALLVKATPEQVAKTIESIKAYLPYSIQYFEALRYVDWQWDNEDTHESIEFHNPELDGMLDQMPDIVPILFKKFFDGEKTIYDEIKSTGIEILVDKPCTDKEGKAVDGSIHNTKSGKICISALRLSKKINYLHLQQSLLGLIVHEYAHRMSATEPEAKTAELLVRGTSEWVTDYEWVSEPKRLLSGLSLTLSSLNSSISGYIQYVEEENFDMASAMLQSVCGDIENIVDYGRSFSDELEKKYQNRVSLYRPKLNAYGSLLSTKTSFLQYHCEDARTTKTFKEMYDGKLVIGLFDYFDSEELRTYYGSILDSYRIYRTLPGRMDLLKKAITDIQSDVKMLDEAIPQELIELSNQ